MNVPEGQKHANAAAGRTSPSCAAVVIAASDAPVASNPSPALKLARLLVTVVPERFFLLNIEDNIPLLFWAGFLFSGMGISA